jgi:dTDP-4-amino-4,6-dideoxygalactose transaminase
MQFREIRTTKEMQEDIAIALERGEYSNGIFVGMVEEKMSRLMHADHAVAVSSGTMGLKIALDAMGIKKDDIVIVPDITFVACALVVMELGATPIFVDVDLDNFNLDQFSVTQAIAEYGNKVKAIMAVRLGGEPIPGWMYDFKVPVIIDSAHSADPIDPRALACVFSFHPSKIISGIEGGCIVTNSAGDAEKARELRNFGFQQGSRIATQAGYKANMTNVSAIAMSHNLNRLGVTLRDRLRIRELFNTKLGLNRKGLGMYMVTVADPGAICTKIPAIRHYPMPLSEMITGVAMNKNAKHVADHLVSIPFHEWLTDSDVYNICDIILSN